MGLVARPVFKTGLRPYYGRGGSIPPHSAKKASGMVGRSVAMRLGQPSDGTNTARRSLIVDSVRGTCNLKPETYKPEVCHDVFSPR